MTEEEIQAQLAAEGVFVKADRLVDDITDIQDAYEWIAERFKAAHERQAKSAKTPKDRELADRLREAHETLHSMVDVLDDSRRDFGYAVQLLGGRPPTGAAANVSGERE